MLKPAVHRELIVCVQSQTDIPFTSNVLHDITHVSCRHPSSNIRRPVTLFPGRAVRHVIQTARAVMAPCTAHLCVGFAKDGPGANSGSAIEDSNLFKPVSQPLRIRTAHSELPRPPWFRRERTFRRYTLPSFTKPTQQTAACLVDTLPDKSYVLGSVYQRMHIGPASETSQIVSGAVSFLVCIIMGRVAALSAFLIQPAAFAFRPAITPPHCRTTNRAFCYAVNHLFDW